MSIAHIPADAAVAINDMLDCCACVKPGQHVLILAAIDRIARRRAISLTNRQSNGFGRECRRAARTLP